jgi:nicotinamide riboside kinase
MPIRICIIGTHGSGKTTLSYLHAVKYKIMGYSTKIIQECARSCPYPLNEGMTKEACLWIYYEQMRKEIEAMQKFDIVICDRGAIDSFIYAKAQKCFDTSDWHMEIVYKAACEWMHSYDEVIYVKPGDIKPIADGVRSDDIAFQKRVEEKFDKWIAERFRKTTNFRTIESKDIFDNITSWI